MLKEKGLKDYSLYSQNFYKLLKFTLFFSGCFIFYSECFAQNIGDVEKAANMQELHEWFQGVLAYGLLTVGGIGVLNSAYQLAIQQNLQRGGISLAAAVLAGGIGTKITVSATLALI